MKICTVFHINPKQHFLQTGPRQRNSLFSIIFPIAVDFRRLNAVGEREFFAGESSCHLFFLFILTYIRNYCDFILSFPLSLFPFFCHFSSFSFFVVCSVICINSTHYIGFYVRVRPNFSSFAVIAPARAHTS